VLHEADLGQDTLSIAGTIKAYNPDSNFHRTE
jgi:hypothetical protein